MSLASMHNDYLDPDRHLPPEPSEHEIKCQRAGRRVLNHFAADHWGQLYRYLYKGTSCGVSVGVLFAGAEEPVYCDYLRQFGRDSWPLQIYISSIVEGVEQTTQTHVVDLSLPRAVRQLMDAVDAVEKEADDIWNETHDEDGNVIND